ncbi:MAG TPA: F0F1 ATP synthase subunit A [Ferruginibacter sp.]|nr:F0F1 ATP synthase subunit A [Ferruginibacter sp.]HRE63691.1 F0F1 ATP synthase subunit A [Ferruginibacter sp.]
MVAKRLKSLLVAVFSLGMLFLSNASFGQEPTHGGEENHQTTGAHSEEEKFDITKTILEHISDDHSWHLWGHTSIPLPVILYSDKGIEFFSSSNLMDEHHAPQAYQGNYLYKSVEGKIKVVNEQGVIDEAATAKVWDFSITKNVASLLLTVVLLLIIFLSVAKAYKHNGVKTAPKGFQSFMEPIILFVRDEVAKPNIGHNYARYMPFLLTIFFLIWINNILGLVPFFPGGANVSGNIAFTMTLALITFLIVNVSGNKNYWQHIFWMPGMPVGMKIFLAPIELLGVFIKPMSLMIRLFANITAGHILVLTLICLIFVFKSIYASALSVPFTLFIGLIELLVAFLQAYIFTMLSAMYIGMAIEEHHHHGDTDPHWNEGETA